MALLTVLLLLGDLGRTSGLMDIPTVPQYQNPGTIGGTIMGSIVLMGEDLNLDDSLYVDPADLDVTLRYGFGKGEIALSMFTLDTWSASVSYLLKKESDSSPAFFAGIDDISYSPYISTLGSGGDDGQLEEINYYKYMNGRAPEIFSAYFAMQKSLGVANVIVGLGRGRFVGYGWRSHVFNTDFFVLGNDYCTEEHSAWAFGLFFGGFLKFPFGLELMAEMDGRDANVGARYAFQPVKLTLGLSKVEYFRFFPGVDDNIYSPKFTFGLEVNNDFSKGAPRVGSIECVAQDLTSKQLLDNTIVDIKELNKRYKATSGIFSMSLPAGMYTITVSRPDYVDYLAKITVKPGVQSKLVFNLKKTEEAQKLEAALRDKQQNIQAALSQGKIYYSEGNLNEARVAFERVLALDPDNAEAKGYLGQIETRKLELIASYSDEARNRVKAKDYNKAREYWKKVLDLDPNNAEAKSAVGTLQQQIAAAKKPDTKPPTKPAETKKPTAAEIEALFKKGVNLFTAEKYDQALKTFNQVLALDPNHKGAKDYKKRTETRLKALGGG